MRVAILWKQMSGYAAQCFRALQAAGVEMSVVYRAAQADAPFDDAVLTRGLPATSWDDHPDVDAVLAELHRFGADAVLIASWDIGGYRRIARQLRGRTLRVLCMDNQWLGTAKQWGGRVVAPLVIRPAFDAAFLPGERQAAFARRLGFGPGRIFDGLYCCDYESFAAVRRSPGAPHRTFVFSGRLVREKGVDVLAGAYRAYRNAVADPWPLLVAGTGPLAFHLAGLPGVEMLGFVQPCDLPSTLARAGCLILPSRFEPWGVVVHEAAAAGLAVLASSASGASTRLVVDGRSGAVVPPGDEVALTRAMVRMTSASDEELSSMAAVSAGLAATLTPNRWAAHLTERIHSLRATVGPAEP